MTNFQLTLNDNRFNKYGSRCCHNKMDRPTYEPLRFTRSVLPQSPCLATQPKFPATQPNFPATQPVFPANLQEENEELRLQLAAAHRTIECLKRERA